MTSFFPRVGAACVALLLCAVARADLVSATNPTSPLAASASFTPAGALVLPGTLGNSQNLLGTLLVNVPGVAGAASTTQPYLLTSNERFELSLWNFVVSIRAQQNNLPLLVANTNLANVGFNLGSNAAAVPLPAAGWLFCSGLAALVGTAWRRRRAGAGLTAQPV